MIEKIVEKITESLTPPRMLGFRDFPGIVALRRPIILQGGELADQGDPRYLDFPSWESLKSELTAKLAGNDAKNLARSVAAGGAATTANPSGITAAVLFRWRDESTSRDNRSFRITASWNDGAAQSQTFDIDPEPGATCVSGLLLLCKQSGGKAVLAASNSSGVTLTVADGAIRAGSILQAENFVVRDLLLLEI